MWYGIKSEHLNKQVLMVPLNASKRALFCERLLKKQHISRINNISSSSCWVQKFCFGWIHLNQSYDQRNVILLLCSFFPLTTWTSSLGPWDVHFERNLLSDHLSFFFSLSFFLSPWFHSFESFLYTCSSPPTDLIRLNSLGITYWFPSLKHWMIKCGYSMTELTSWNGIHFQPRRKLQLTTNDQITKIA